VIILLKADSRIELLEGIRFYEQDILYDDYIYTGSCQIELDIDYYNNGFGIVLINATNNLLTSESPAILFRLNHKSVEVIYKESALQKVLGTYSSSYARTCTDNLKMILRKRDDRYTLSIGDQIVCTLNCDYKFDSYFIGYYSNKDNTINHISIASTVPYGWIVNMQHTNGGYIDFHRDGFELKQCKGLAEIEQIEINLLKGRYYVKYDQIDSDIKPYVMLSDDDRVYDDEKNILNSDGSFVMNQNSKISLKFKGTKGRINNIAITTAKDNEYARTSPDFENVKIIDDSYIRLNMKNIKSFWFKGNVKTVPGIIHEDPIDYSVIRDDKKSYGIYDLNIATGVYYSYRYENGILNIVNNNNHQTVEGFPLTGDYVYLYCNLNGKITDFVITDSNGDTTNITIENTIKQYVPAVIKSPIVIVDENELPLNISSSYRYYYKNNKKYYWFTNTEREYFEPNNFIMLEESPINIDGSVIVYGIKHNSTWDLDKLLEIEDENFDSLNACADSYDVIFEENLRYINKETGEIRLEDVSNYKYIVVDYLKDNSYCLNFRYHLNSYEIDISVLPDKKIKMLYDNIGYNINDLRFINEIRYVDTGIVPTLNGYITIGGGTD
jgi:hypothetical protein